MVTPVQVIQKDMANRTKNGTLQTFPKFQVFFYRSSLGNEPVKVWIKSLRVGLWEIRIRRVNRIARVVFVVFEGNIVLLHGFIKKKQQETPKVDLQLAVKRLKSLQKD